MPLQEADLRVMVLVLARHDGAGDDVGFYANCYDPAFSGLTKEQVETLRYLSRRLSLLLLPNMLVLSQIDREKLTYTHLPSGQVRARDLHDRRRPHLHGRRNQLCAHTP